jgi:GT2 family glycosyltransferase
VVPDGPPVAVVAPTHVAAVVVSWNQADQLLACLDALDRQTHPDLEVVVVDNASHDGTAAVLDTVAARGWRHPLTVVRNRTNRGFAGGVNDGIAAAPTADTLWLVNVDARPDPDHLARLVAVLVDDPTCAAVQGTLVRSAPGPDGSPVIDSTGIELTRAGLFRDRDETRPDAGLARRPGEVFGVTGACSVFRRAALDDVAWGEGAAAGQHLTEDLFAYFEDVELAWRLQRAGWRCRYEPAARAVHERGGAGPRRSAVVEELNAANRLLVLRTSGMLPALRRHLPLVVATTLLKSAELAVTVPTALRPAARRLRAGWAAAGARRAELERRARVPAVVVVDRFAQPFRWGPWIVTWWRRVTGRAIGVAGGGRPPRRTA